jgi:hypothetical protein
LSLCKKLLAAEADVKALELQIETQRRVIDQSVQDEEKEEI